MNEENFGAYIRRRREEKSFSLSKVATHMNIDVSMLSKVERGDRQLNKQHIPLLAEILDSSKRELETRWLTDQLLHLLKNEPTANLALRTALKKIKQPR